MNYYMKIAVASLFTMLLSVSIPAEAQNMPPKKVFMFGFAQSFNDSTVYFTDIQVVDSAYIEHKTKFLAERENYSYQLKSYLENKGKRNMVCGTSFAETRKDIEKKYMKMKQRYGNRGHYSIQYINENEMKFESIKPIFDESVTRAATKAEIKAQKKAAKKEKKDGPKPSKGKR